MKNKILISFLIAGFLFLAVGFGIRCFPLGCELLNWSELLKVLVYVSIPGFILVYIIIYFSEKRNRLF
jgi:hypothetical protein